MQQAGKSIAARALFMRPWLLALCATVATQRASYARADESVVEIAYSAPAGCPTKPQFEQRLRARLGSDARAIHGGLSLRLTQHPTHTRGELTITSGPRSGARREVEAASCDEAVDALTLVTALLIEPERAEPPPSARRAASPPRPSRAPSAEAAEAGSSATNAQGSRTTSDAQPSDVVATTAAIAATREQTVRTDHSDRESEPRAQKLAPKPPEPATQSTSATRPAANSESSLSVELLAAGLLATGAMPASRPGAELRASLLRTWPSGLAGALELGVRSLAPQLETGPQGRALFSFYGGTAALCLAQTGARFGAALCALTELARLSAQGRKTESPKRADVFWRALGPAVRTSLHLTPRWSLALGAELLFPLARDSFELGGTALWRVPSLTFRGSLGVVLRFE